MKKTIPLLLLLLALAVSCATVPQAAGTGAAEPDGQTPAAMPGDAAPEPELEPADFAVPTLAPAFAAPVAPHAGVDASAPAAEVFPASLDGGLLLARSEASAEVAEATETVREAPVPSELALTPPVFEEPALPEVLATESFVAQRPAGIELAAPAFTAFVAEPYPVSPAAPSLAAVPSVPRSASVPQAQLSREPARSGPSSGFLPSALRPAEDAQAEAQPNAGEPPPAVQTAQVWRHAPTMPELPNPVPDFLGLPDIIPQAASPLAFSRVVHATAGQIVEVPFRGNGWIFLGETEGRRGISFDARRPDSEGQTFVFRTESAGEYALRFYRRDFVRDVILNDHVQVIVGEAEGSWLRPASAGRVVAERWPNPLDEARILRASGRFALPEIAESGDGAELPSEAGFEASSPVAALAALPPELPAPPEPVPAPVPPVVAPPPAQPEAPALPGLGFGSPFDLLPMALEEFEAGRVDEAISLVGLFRELHPSGSDEAWWLLGQFFEADSPSRNILAALNYYHRLVREYPQSSRLVDARRRIAFLERFFLNIR